jgi:hypothetical protein
MQLPTPVKVFFAAAPVAATGLWLATRHGAVEAPSATPSEASSISLDEAAPHFAQPPVPSSAAADKMRELAALSETFRNTTFVIAIRDAGFVCHDVIDVYGGVNTSRTWTATCRDMLAYTVHVTDDGALAVEPMLQQLDTVTRPLLRQPQPLDRVPLEPLEPR